MQLAFHLALLFVVPSFSILEKELLLFIEKNYGNATAELLNRADLGPNGDGSFGGALVPRSHRPVLLIHGFKNKAGYLWRTREALKQAGWEPHHVLATSYGDGDAGFNFFTNYFKTIECSYVKQIRLMMEVLLAYYKSKIDVIAFSMGSAIARKAILGGYCVDTQEDLGNPLSDNITVYLSVAGSTLCLFPFPGVCSKVNGLNCLSEFYRDINKQTGYEGEHIYTIISDQDEMIGVINGCGKRSGEIRGATEIEIHGFSHKKTMFERLEEQVNIMKRHEAES